MPSIQTDITQKSADFLERMILAKKAANRGEAIDYLINQQIKRRGDAWLKAGEKRANKVKREKAAKKQKPVENTGDSSAAMGRILQAWNTSPQKPQELSAKFDEKSQTDKEHEIKKIENQEKNWSKRLVDISKLDKAEVS